MELIPVSNTSPFFTETVKYYSNFANLLDGVELQSGLNIFHVGPGITNYTIYQPFGDEKDGTHNDLYRTIPQVHLPLEIFEDSDSTTLLLSLQVVSTETNNANVQVSYTKPDPKFSRYIMPIEIPENSGILLGNTDVTMEEGSWYEWPIEKSQRSYNNNEDDEDLIILIHDVVKTKQANTSVIKTYLENIEGNVSTKWDDDVSKDLISQTIEKIDNGELEDNYQRTLKYF